MALNFINWFRDGKTWNKSSSWLAVSIKWCFFAHPLDCIDSKPNRAKRILAWEGGDLGSNVASVMDPFFWLLHRADRGDLGCNNLKWPRILGLLVLSFQRNCIHLHCQPVWVSSPRENWCSTEQRKTILNVGNTLPETGTQTKYKRQWRKLAEHWHCTHPSACCLLESEGQPLPPVPASMLFYPRLEAKYS